MKDPFVDEVRRFRMEHTKEFNVRREEFIRRTTEFFNTALR